jgi:hypothetical protein
MSNNAHEFDVVDWDGPNDPENPNNWSSTRKITATLTIALISILTYVEDL